MPPATATPKKMPFEKYQPFVPIVLTDRTWPNVVIDKAPLWCRVDLRDGNQALIDPMDPTRKLHMFDELVKMGFKEIEVGFPSASQPDFDFVRQLIEEDLIPDDVTIQVLVQCRQELIERTYECIAGCAAGDRALLQLDQPAAARGRVRPRQGRHRRRSPSTPPSCAASWRRRWSARTMRYEYSPESFTLTEPEFAIEICEAVMDVIEPTPDRPDHPQPAGDGRVLHAQRLRRRDRVVLPHDQATATRSSSACTRTTTAAAGRRRRVRRDGRRRPGRGHAVRQRRAHRQRRHRQPGDEPVQQRRRPRARHHRHRRACAASPSTATACPCTRAIRTSATSCTPRSAAATRTRSRRASTRSMRAATPTDYDQWGVPYLPIDPKHVGRSYEAVIRVNSQSGKGGVAYVMKEEHGFDLPRRLQIEFSKTIQHITEDSGTEISPALDVGGVPARVPPRRAVASGCAATSSAHDRRATARRPHDDHGAARGRRRGPLRSSARATVRSRRSSTRWSELGDCR